PAAWQRRQPAFARLERQDNVLADRQLRHDAFGLAVFGQECETTSDARARRGEGCRPVLDEHSAQVGAVDAKEKPGDFCAPGPQQPREADDFPLADFQVERLDNAAASEALEPHERSLYRL